MKWIDPAHSLCVLKIQSCRSNPCQDVRHFHYLWRFPGSPCQLATPPCSIPSLLVNTVAVFSPGIRFTHSRASCEWDHHIRALTSFMQQIASGTHPFCCFHQRFLPFNPGGGVFGCGLKGTLTLVVHDPAPPHQATLIISGRISFVRTAANSLPGGFIQANRLTACWARHRAWRLSCRPGCSAWHSSHPRAGRSQSGGLGPCRSTALFSAPEARGLGWILSSPESFVFLIVVKHM